MGGLVRGTDARLQPVEEDEMTGGWRCSSSLSPTARAGCAVNKPWPSLVSRAQTEDDNVVADKQAMEQAQQLTGGAWLWLSTRATGTPGAGAVRRP
jgi:hypothetical protein